MSIFGSILSSIFGASSAHASEAKPIDGSAPVSTAPAAPASGMATASGKPADAAKPLAAIDMAKILDDKAAAKGEALDWRRSIVDLMKSLDLDSGLGARRSLAAELGYTGDTKDTAKMNVWLHKAVMVKLAENGGNVPASLKD